mgnify:CR=1 FL=1
MAKKVKHQKPKEEVVPDATESIVVTESVETPEEVVETLEEVVEAAEEELADKTEQQWDERAESNPNDQQKSERL